MSGSPTALILATLFAFSAEASPFGLEMGTPIDKLSIVKEISRYSYMITAPNPSSDFEEYDVFATPQDGVCQIRAYGNKNETDSAGILAREQFTSLASLLDEKYGRYETSFDRIFSDSPWNKPNDFAMSLQQNQRTLLKFWTNKKSKLPDNIQTIALNAQGLSRVSTVISLIYQFSNMGSCSQHLKEKNKEAL